MTCQRCLTLNTQGAVVCSACGAPLMAPPPGAGYGPGYGYPPPGYGHSSPYLSGPTRTSGMAIAGFVLSFFCGLLGLIFSIIGYNECKNANGEVSGEGLALAGIIISIVSMVLGILWAMSAPSFVH
jgi:hypothetical protein